MENVIDISSEVQLLFSSSLVCPALKEDFSEVEISYLLKLEKLPVEEDYYRIINKLNERDSFHLSVLKDGDVVENFTNRNDENFNKYVDNLKQSLTIDDTIELVFTIVKNKIDNILSIYYLDEFIAYINSLSFLSFLNIIESTLERGILRFEIQEDNLSENTCSTQTISIYNRKSGVSIFEIENKYRDNTIRNATTLCHWDISNKSILPDDLLLIINDNANTELIKVFQKVGLLYTTMFIFDYINLNNNIFLYKLNGYKTFGQEINTAKIEDINIDYNSADLFHRIYKWIYNGGNTNDKISIARNIISLNYDSETLKLSNTTFDSILSNFKIYERQNVKQYIEVRNKLSEILIDLQGKIDKIVDGFTSDYKKNIITLISFFISVIAIRVVSKGDFVGGFTNEIIILAYSFLVISIGILIYSRWEFVQRVSMFDKHYDQLKGRYKEILSEDELKEIFEHCNPKNKQTRSFVNQQKKFYTILWIGSIIVLAIALIIIFFINNSESHSIIINFLKFILCCTKNI